MISREETERLKRELIAALREDAHNVERLVRRLDALAKESGVGAHAALLTILTQLPFEETDAKAHWEAIVAHRHEMSVALGRDVGIRVAVFDYFLNVNRRLTNPALIDIAMESVGGADPGVDAVTGLVSDRVFRTTLQNEMRRARRYGLSVAVALFDMDDFLDVDRRVGRVVSDRFLREAAILLGNKIRDIDVAGRPGEDEFALVLPETERNGALLVAERFRREVESHFRRRRAPDGRTLDLTVSGGVACYPADARAPEELLGVAAQALYAAKASGKNLVLLAGPERRRFVRFDLAGDRWEVEVLAPRAVQAGPALNLSRNGLLFGSPEALEVGERVELRLVAGSAGARPLRILGRVVRLEDIVDGGSDAASSVDRFVIGIAFERGGDGAEPDLMDILDRGVSGGGGRRA